MDRTADRNVLTINGAFLYEELIEGALGSLLTPADAERLEALPAGVLADALDEGFDDTTHPIHAALDALVTSAVDHLRQRGLLAGPDED